MRKILRIFAIVLAVLLACAAVILAANSCLVGTVTDVREGRCLIVEVENAGSYHIIERMVLGETVERVRLHVRETDGFHVGGRVIAFTSGAQEHSNPPGIRALLAEPLE